MSFSFIIRVSFHITYLIFYSNCMAKVALQDIQHLGMALLRRLQLRNSLKKACGIGQAMTLSQRVLHSKNASQNTEAFRYSCGSDSDSWTEAG